MKLAFTLLVLASCSFPQLPAIEDDASSEDASPSDSMADDATPVDGAPAPEEPLLPIIYVKGGTLHFGVFDAVGNVVHAPIDLPPPPPTDNADWSRADQVVRDEASGRWGLLTWGLDGQPMQLRLLDEGPDGLTQFRSLELGNRPNPGIGAIPSVVFGAGHYHVVWPSTSLGVTLVRRYTADGTLDGSSQAGTWETNPSIRGVCTTLYLDEDDPDGSIVFGQVYSGGGLVKQAYAGSSGSLNPHTQYGSTGSLGWWLKHKSLPGGRHLLLTSRIYNSTTASTRSELWLNICNQDCSTRTSMSVASGNDQDTDDPSFSVALNLAGDRAVVAMGTSTDYEMALRVFDVNSATASQLGSGVTVPGVKRYFKKVIRLPSGRFRVYFTTNTVPVRIVYRDYDLVGDTLQLRQATTPFGEGTDLSEVAFVLNLGGSLGGDNASYSDREP